MLAVPPLLDERQVSASIPLLLRWSAQGDGEQPQRRLLVGRQAGDGVDCLLDLVERLSALEQLLDRVPAAGEILPVLGSAHRRPPSLVPSLPRHVSEQSQSGTPHCYSSRERRNAPQHFRTDSTPFSSETALPSCRSPVGGVAWTYTLLSGLQRFLSLCGARTRRGSAQRGAPCKSSETAIPARSSRPQRCSCCTSTQAAVRPRPRPRST